MRKYFYKIISLTIVMSVLFVSLLPASSLTLAANTITLDKKVTYQTMDGFGASATLPVDQLMLNYNEEDQKDILDFLFTPEGIDLSMVRLEVNAKYRIPTKSFIPVDTTIEPVEGVWDWDTDHHQKWLAREAMDRGVSRFMASVWSPPAWMKMNTFSVVGGQINPAYIGHYADYLKTYVLHYANDFGINVGWVSVQNEPDYNAPWQSCVYSPDDMIPVINTVSKNFETNDIWTKLLAPECSSTSQAYSFMFGMDFDRPVSKKLYAIAFHDYSQSTQPMLKNFGRPLWLTETCGLEEEDITITDGLRWSNSVMDQINAGSSTYFYWWLVNSADDTTRAGLVNLKLDTTPWTYTIPKRAYAIGQYSRFVRPGYVKIGSKSSNSSLKQLAFKDPTNGKAVLVVTNNGDEPQSSLISGFTASKVKLYRTSDTESLTALADMDVVNGSVNMSFPAKSITTMVEDTPDNGAPSAISNVKAENAIDGVQLKWTAPGDTGKIGVANKYDIRISDSPIAESDFSSASVVKGAPAPLSAGRTQSYLITGLDKGKTYYFAVKTLDEAGNISDISNIASIKFKPKYSKPKPPTNVRVKLNDKYLIFDIQPQIKDGTASVQLRTLLEAMGVEVTWDGENKKITCKKEDTTLILKAGSRTITVNRVKKRLDSPAYIISSRTMAPVRSLANTFGADVEWDDSSRTIVISSR